MTALGAFSHVVPTVTVSHSVTHRLPRLGGSKRFPSRFSSASAHFSTTTTTMAAFVGRSALLRSSLHRSGLHSSRQRLHSGSLHLPPSPHAGRRLTGAVLLGVPLIGGSLLYLYPTSEPSVVPTLLANPSVIPCTDSDNCPRTRSMQTHQISSPNEPRRSVLQRVLDVLWNRIWEPLRTGARFLHLFAIFAPVILTSPMLFVGAPSKSKKRGERWGAIWWYGFFTAQMQRAGPTFIKVRPFLST